MLKRFAPLLAVGLLVLTACSGSSSADAESPQAFVEQVLLDVHAIVAANPANMDEMANGGAATTDWLRELPVHIKLRDYYKPLIHADTPVEWDTEDVVWQVFSDGLNPSLCHDTNDPWELKSIEASAAPDADGRYRVSMVYQPPNLGSIRFEALVVETGDGWRFAGFPFRGEAVEAEPSGE